MAWHEIHQSLPTHKKTSRLMRRLGIDRPTAVGALVMFWGWSIDNAPQGDITGLEDDELADVMGLTHTAGLIDLMVEIGWLDRFDGTVVIHDWADYLGKLERSRASNRHRQQEYRSRNRDKPPPEHERNSYVTRDSGVTNGLHNAPQYSTVQNSTQENRTGDVVVPTRTRARDDDHGDDHGNGSPTVSSVIRFDEHPFLPAVPPPPSGEFAAVAEILQVRGNVVAERALHSTLTAYQDVPNHVFQAEQWAAKIGGERNTPGKRAASFREWLEVCRQTGSTGVAGRPPERYDGIEPLQGTDWTAYLRQVDPSIIVDTVAHDAISLHYLNPDVQPAYVHDMEMRKFRELVNRTECAHATMHVSVGGETFVDYDAKEQSA